MEIDRRFIERALSRREEIADHLEAAHTFGRRVRVPPDVVHRHFILRLVHAALTGPYFPLMGSNDTRTRVEYIAYCLEVSREVAEHLVAVYEDAERECAHLASPRWWSWEHVRMWLWEWLMARELKRVKARKATSLLV